MPKQPMLPLVAVPAFNEAEYIEPLVTDLLEYLPAGHVLVVNDGSTDATGVLARRTGVRVIDHPVNRGKGAAIQTAIQFGRLNHFKWILFMDGDGQHRPESIPRFLSVIHTDAADAVLGDRRERHPNMPLLRQLSNGLTSVMVSLCAGTRIRDSQCGFRAIRLSCLPKISFRESGFQVESELLIKLGKSGARFAHVPIETIYGPRSSSIRPVSDTLKFVKLILKSVLS